MAAALLVVLSQGSAGKAAKKEQAETNAILPGAEPRDLGPADAPCAVLLVHGFLGGGSNFADLPERLAAEGFRVRVMRLPGHGTCPEDLRGVTADELLQAVLDETAALRARHEQVVLLGHSMGAALSTLAAAREPVDGLVLAGGYFGITQRWYTVMPAETWAKVATRTVKSIYKGERFKQVNRREARPHILSYKVMPTTALTALLDIGKRASQPETLARVTCPVLMLHARGDKAACPRAAAKAFDELGAASKEAVWLTKSNHHIFWDYEQEAVMDAVVRFVRTVRDGQAPR